MKQSVKLGNEKSNVAVCTLWTPLEIVERHLDRDSYAVIGQLYSKDAGLNTVLRYCLFNKNIRYIVVCGQDRSQSGQALISLKEKGVDDERSVRGVSGARVDNEIPLDAVESFRKNVDVIDARNVTDYSVLKQVIAGLPLKTGYGSPESFPEARVEVPMNFPTDPVFKIRARTIGEAWLQALSTIMKFGALKESQHEEKQKEIICLSTIITHEDPDKPQWKPYFAFPEEELEEYYPQVLTDQKVPEITYTYGQRLRSHKGVDQISKIARKLNEHPHTRRAVAVTWDVNLDMDSINPPCLNLVQAIIQGDKLYLIAYLRSNDIYGAWPKNAYALRKLQKQLCAETGKELGETIMISASAHVYERHFRQAQEVLREYPLDKNISFELPRSTGNLDPRGNIHISVEGGRIKVTHLSPDGQRLEEFLAASSQEASRWIVLEQKASDISHAIYIGQELMRAELALKKGLKYEQDQINTTY
ncbi:thymidylate synthase [Candidatus Woesearchaeota archaeon]|nr:thymidylate synthase [Candidatus Woesearchaeota archaeon]